MVKNRKSNVSLGALQRQKYQQVANKEKGCTTRLNPKNIYSNVRKGGQKPSITSILTAVLIIFTVIYFLNNSSDDAAATTTSTASSSSAAQQRNQQSQLLPLQPLFLPYLLMDILHNVLPNKVVRYQQS